MTAQTSTWARNRYERNRRHAKAAGDWQPFAAAQPVREHIEAHRRAGVGTRQLATLAGVQRRTIQIVVAGRDGQTPPGRVYSITADRLLAVPVAAAHAADHANVDATGTHRRMQGMCLLGWSLGRQSALVGWSRANYGDLFNQPHVMGATARIVDGLCRQLCMTPAPASHSALLTRRWAQRQGFLPLMVWDDDTIDDPDAHPNLGVVLDGETADEGVVWLALHGWLDVDELPPAERAVVRRRQRETQTAVAA